MLQRPLKTSAHDKAPDDMSQKVLTRPAVPADVTSITKLHASVFGPGRFARTAYRVREGGRVGASPAISPYCRVAALGSRIIAAVKFAEITVGGMGQALLLGPLVVDTEFEGQGYGRQLVTEGLAAAKDNGVALVVLVGDEPYYGRLGFARVPPGQISLPGPANPARILAAALQPDAFDRYRGVIAAA
jgi:predicted N-acetyltransferase YhbS